MPTREQSQQKSREIADVLRRRTAVGLVNPTSVEPAVSFDPLDPDRMAELEQAEAAARPPA